MASTFDCRIIDQSITKDLFPKAHAISIPRVRKAISKLVKIIGQVFCTDFMKRSDYSAFQHIPKRFYAICVNLAAHIFIPVVNPLWVIIHSELVIGGELINAKHLRPRVHIFSHYRAYGICFWVFCYLCSNTTAALSNPDNEHFVSCASPRFAMRNSADISIIYFYDADELFNKSRLAHSAADSVHEIPCSLISDFKVSFNLFSGDSFFSVADKDSSKYPLAKGKVGTVENSPHGHRELVEAIKTLEQIAGAYA